MMSTTMALVVALLAQVSAPGLDAALHAAREGGPIPAGTGELAVHAIGSRPRMPVEDLELHLLVATRGGARAEGLARILRDLLAEDASLEPCLRAIGHLDLATGGALVAGLGASAARARVVEACLAEDEQVARGALLLLPANPPQVVVDVVRRLAAAGRLDHATLGLEGLAGRVGSQAMLEALLEAEPHLPPALDRPLGEALASNVDDVPKLAALVLERVREQPTPARLGALAATPPALREEAVAVVMHLVADLLHALDALERREVELLAAAVGAAGELRAAELLGLLPDLCRPAAPVAVRLAGLRALSDLGARDAAIVDLLLAYIDEPGPLGATAYAGLCLRAGVRLPNRPASWRAWRKKTTLPELTPEEHDARLQADRTNRYNQRQSLRPARD